MKYIAVLLILIVTTGCPAYDPPLKGNDIFIHNQTGGFVYVLDSLPAGALPLYDTFSINHKPIIEAKPNFISPYKTWDYFFEEAQYQRLKQMGIDSLAFYFFPLNDFDSSYIKLNANQHYTVAKLRIEDAWNKTVNHIFYFGDSIEITHEYNMGAWNGTHATQ